MSDIRDPSTDPQSPPTPGDGRDVTEAVIEDLRGRRAMGVRKYQTFLQPFNGRDALLDAYHELLDGAAYLKTAMMERDTPSAPSPADLAIAAAAKGCYLMGRMPGKYGKPEIIIGFDEDRDAWGFLKAVAGAIKGYREGEETEG